jgi:HemY protein
MRSLFWLLLLGLLAIGVALLGRFSEGYVLWVVPPWRIEASFNLYVLAQLGALLLAYLLLRGIANTLRLPSVVSEYRARRARRRDERLAAEALRMLWEGRYSHALKNAEKVMQHGREQEVGAGGTGETAAGIAALVGFKAAYALRDETRLPVWRAHAESMDAAGWRTARLLGEIAVALDARDFPAAQAAFGQLGTKERRQISAQRLALRMAQGQGDWAELLRIARLLEKHGALTPDQARPLCLRAYHGVLDNLQDDPVQLMRYWRKMNVADRQDLRLAQRAARALSAAGACAESAHLIEEYLDERWESVLLEDYASCEGADVLGRIAHCETWLHEHQDDAMLLLTLGRLCVLRQLWGKAQSYFEASLAVASGCAAHIELARLFDQLERPDEANRHYRAAAQCQDGALQIQSRGERKSV